MVGAVKHDVLVICQHKQDIVPRRVRGGQGGQRDPERHHRSARTSTVQYSTVGLRAKVLTVRLLLCSRSHHVDDALSRCVVLSPLCEDHTFKVLLDVVGDS